MIVINAFIEFGYIYDISYLFGVFIITFVISFVSTKTIGAFGLKKKRVKAFN